MSAFNSAPAGGGGSSLPDDTGHAGEILTADGTGNPVWGHDFISQEPDGASAAAWTLDTATSYATTGAKLLSVRNGTVEKSSIKLDGSGVFGTTTIDGTTGLISNELATTAPYAPFYRVSTSEGGVAFGRFSYGGYLSAYNKNGNVGGRQAQLGLQGHYVRVYIGTTNSTGDLNISAAYFDFTTGGNFYSSGALVVNSLTRTNDIPPNTSTYAAHNALPTATVNISGANTTVKGGNGASASSGAANGGDVLVTGGTGYGTGRQGYIKLSGAAVHASAPATAPASADQANSTATGYLADSQKYFAVQAKDSGGNVSVGRVSLGTHWKDLTVAGINGRVGAANAPTLTAFTPGGSGGLLQYAFIVGDYILASFHVNHDIKPNGQAFFHVHWTTDGTSTASVKWEVEYSLALGHNQAAFSTPAIITVEEAASGTAYQHMVTETATPITLAEPDIMLIARLRRITNGGTNNADTVFGLAIDLHYESDRDATPNRAPPFI
jgi:hypothetical protein